MDEIYQTCESDESVTQCKEVIMVLDNFTREFKNLISWFKIKWEYETTPPPQRPRSLAWEIRKSSPGKLKPKVEINPNGGNYVSCVNSSVQSFFDNKSEYPMLKSKDETFSITENCHKLSNSNSILQNNTIAEETSSLNAEIVQDKVKKKNYSNSGSKANCLLNTIEEVNANLLVEEERNITCTKENSDASDNHYNTVGNSSQQVSLKEISMVDEVCQTDPEKDVDENGPKFRSSSQQTCSLLTGFDINSFDSKEKSKLIEGSETGKKLVAGSNNLIMLKGVTKGKKPEEILKEDNKFSNKPASSLALNKTVLISTSTGKPVVKNSYSNVINSTKSVNGIQNTTKTVPLVKSSSVSTNSRVSTPILRRQPWGARPVLAKTLSTASNTPRSIVRSQTLGEVQRNSMSKAAKTVSRLKQVG